MIIEIPKLPEDGAHFAGEVPATILGIDDEADIRTLSPVFYDLFVQLVSHRLVVQGRLSAELEVECSRCTDFFSTTLEDSSFLRAYELPEGAEKVDLTEDLREAVLLQIPGFPVCKPDCKGLCPQCGQDLNKGTCSCRPHEVGSQWDALNGLEIRENESDGQ